MSLYAFVYVRTQEEEATRHRYEVAAHNSTAAIQREVVSAIEALRTLQAVRHWQIGQQTTFAALLQDLRPDQHSRHLFVWLPRVLGQHRHGFEQAAQDAGDRDFAIREIGSTHPLVPAQARQEYYPVLLVSPESSRPAVLGYDSSFRPGPGMAIRQAIDTGHAAASAAVTFVQDPTGTYGALIYLPVYGTERIPATRQERRTQARGVLLAGLRAGTLVEAGLHYLAPQGLDLIVQDEQDGQHGARTLYRHASRSGRSAKVSGISLPFQRVPEFRSTLDLCGRHWTLLARPSQPTVVLPWAVFLLPVSGGCLTLLAALYLELLNRRSARTRALVARRTVQLRRATVQAQAAGRAKSQFIANMSHEIRTPINGVQGMAELLAAEPLSPTQADYVATIRRCSQGLLQLVTSILDFAKGEAGHLTPRPRAFSLRQEIAAVTALYPPSRLHPGVDLATAVADTLPDQFWGDADRIRQVLLNLLNNAAKFTRQGLIRVNAELAGQRGSDWHVRLSVSDTGPGISPADQSRLFAPFTQLDESDARQHEGVGLGLSICRQLAELLQGKITLVSAPGVGSTFTLSLPLRAAPATEQLPLQAMVRRVLLVEDNPVNQRIARGQLERLGCQVSLAKDGHEAVERFKSSAYDLVLMDCQMPRMDGYEATAAIRALGGERRVPIVALTASAMPGDRGRCLEAGMDEYLSKPHGIDQLAAVLQRWATPVAAHADVTTLASAT